MSDKSHFCRAIKWYKSPESDFLRGEFHQQQQQHRHRPGDNCSDSCELQRLASNSQESIIPGLLRWGSLQRGVGARGERVALALAMFSCTQAAVN